MSKDRKTANMATPNGKQAKIGNAFGLPSGLVYSCPGATEICDGVCYAGRLEKIFKGMRENMLYNWELLATAGIIDMYDMLTEVIDTFEDQCDKWNAPKSFRIHHDGDFFSFDYAIAWRWVMEDHPNVKFWAYTRSFQYVPALAGPDNFTLYLSVDKANANAALATYNTYPWVKLAALDKTFDGAKQLLADIFDAKGVRCPEINGAIALITVDGGACMTCGLCIDGRNNVTFSSSKK